MNQGYTILLVEDDMNDVQFVRQIVFQQLPEAVFMHAASFAEARIPVENSS